MRPGKRSKVEEREHARGLTPHAARKAARTLRGKRRKPKAFEGVSPTVVDETHHHAPDMISEVVGVLDRKTGARMIEGTTVTIEPDFSEFERIVGEAMKAERQIQEVWAFPVDATVYAISGDVRLPGVVVGAKGAVRLIRVTASRGEFVRGRKYLFNVDDLEPRRAR